MGWAIALGGVFAYDAWLIRTGRHSLSETYGTALHHPYGGPLTVAGVALLLAHLNGSVLPIPQQMTRLDPISAAARLVRKRIATSP